MQLTGTAYGRGLRFQNLGQDVRPHLSVERLVERCLRLASRRHDRRTQHLVRAVDLLPADTGYGAAQFGLSQRGLRIGPVRVKAVEASHQLAFDDASSDALQDAPAPAV